MLFAHLERQGNKRRRTALDRDWGYGFVSRLNGSDAAVIAMRGPVAQSHFAPELQARNGVVGRVIYCHTIKPLDTQRVLIRKKVIPMEVT